MSYEDFKDGRTLRREAEIKAPLEARIAELEAQVAQHHDVNILSECHWCGWQDKAALRGDPPDD